MENPTKEKFFSPSTVLLQKSKDNESSFEQTDFNKINETIAEGRKAIEDIRRANYDSLIPSNETDSEEPEEESTPTV